MLAELLSSEGLPICPIVVITGSAGEDLGRAVLRAGAQDYIGKDWLTPPGLTRAIENATERWAMTRELLVRSGRDAYRVTLTEALRPIDDPKAVQVIASQVLGKHLGANRVVYAEVEANGVVVLGPGYADGVNDISGRYRLDDFGPVLQREYNAGRPVVASDVSTDPIYTDTERRHYREIQVAANLGFPLMKDGRLVSILSVHQSVPRRWTDDEVAMVAETAEATWAAVQRARAEAELRASEERLRLALDAAGAGTWESVPATGEFTASERRQSSMDFLPECPNSTNRLSPPSTRTTAPGSNQPLRTRLNWSSVPGRIPCPPPRWFGALDRFPWCHPHRLFTATPDRSGSRHHRAQTGRAVAARK